MKVIGAGFPRTGTMSTKVALEMLGFGPCYHFVTQLERPQDVCTWQAAAEGKSIDWKALFADFRAAVDWPASAFYKQLIELYPDAKVLLTVRDPEAWYRSVSNTVYPASHTDVPERPIFTQIGHLIDMLGWQKIFHGRFEDKTYAISVFEQYQQEVKAYVPADRLLVWDVKEGWEALCAFLDVPVPDVPFPRLNDTKMFIERFMDNTHRSL